MDEKRIRDAEKNFRNFLSDGLLNKKRFRNEIFERYIENSLESLRVADTLFSEKTSILWTVVTSYYSMFYIACAYIYRKGYKARHQIVHKVINETLIVLAKDELVESLLEAYQEEKEKALCISENLLDSFEYERGKRGTFQYDTTVELKETRAKTSLNRAKEFVSTFRQLLDR